MDTSILLPVLTAFFTFLVGGMLVYSGGNQQKQVHLKAQKLINQRTIRHKPGKSQQQLSLKKLDIDAQIGIFRLIPTISKLRERLDRTGRNISIRRYYTWVFITFASSLLAFKLVFGSSLIVSILMSIFLALMIPHIMVGRWENKRLKKFLTLLPDALELMVRGLKAGLPVSESINVIRTEIGDPVSGVFAEIAQSVKMGVNFEDALLQTAAKLKINEFNFFVISIALQRETGGNLAEILENLATTIRSRAMMKLKIKAITSEARMSAYIVGALPFFVTLALILTTPGYLAPLFNDIRGNIAFGGACCMFCFGMFTMFKMARFEI